MKRTKRVVEESSTKQAKPSTLAEVQERIEGISSLRAQLVARSVALSALLEAGQRELGRQFLRGDRSGIERRAECQAELDGIAAALEVLDEDEAAAKVELEQARATDCRAQAEQKRRELEALNAKTAPLLAKLGELEGVTYGRAILSSQWLAGSWHVPFGPDEPEEWRSLAELTPAIPGKPEKVAVPRSRRLMREIEELQQEAERIEHRLAADEERKRTPVPTRTVFRGVEMPA